MEGETVPAETAGNAATSKKNAVPKQEAVPHKEVQEKRTDLLELLRQEQQHNQVHVTYPLPGD